MGFDLNPINERIRRLNPGFEARLMPVNRDIIEIWFEGRLTAFIVDLREPSIGLAGYVGGETVNGIPFASEEPLGLVFDLSSKKDLNDSSTPEELAECLAVAIELRQQRAIAPDAKEARGSPQLRGDESLRGRLTDDRRRNWHWANDPYWTEALDRYVRRRKRRRKITIDIDRMEALIYRGDISPAYRLMDAMCSVRECEGGEGYRGAPRLVLALLQLLSEVDAGGEPDTQDDSDAVQQATGH